MAKKSESPATGATAAPESVLTEAAGNLAPASETATAATVAAQTEGKAQAMPSADPTVELDDTDKAAAGSWDDLEPRRMTVAYKPGIYLRIGPGKNYSYIRVLPAGTEVAAMPVPDYAKVPGWLCVAADSGHADKPLYGWVDETLVEDVTI